MTRRLPFAIASIAICLTACATTTGPATETEAEICRQWGASLPTRSRQDTKQTQDEIQAAYAAFALACPDWAHLVP